MIGISWLKSRMLRMCRKGYNSRRYRSSRTASKLTHLLFRDLESLDILSRSQLNLGNFAKAAKSYRRAEKLGFKLLDHDKNHFKAELKSGDLVESFKIAMKSNRNSERRLRLSGLRRELRRLPDPRRVELIEEMGEISTIPIEIAELLPWTPRKVDFDSKQGDSYSTLSDESLQSDRFRREITRIRSSSSYKVSELIGKSLRNPIRALLLPFTVTRLLFDIFFRRTGHTSSKVESFYPISRIENTRDCIVFFPTNGVGFGHFTRMLAIARIYKRKFPESEVVFFTTMPTLHILASEGIVCYHLPGRYKYREMEPSTWNSICEEMLNLVFSLHRPRAFIFDGAYPYRGMLNAIQSYPDGMLKIWLRRGAIKKGSKGIPVDSIAHFHAVIRPGDSVKHDFDDETKHSVPIVKTNPILLYGESELEPRGTLRNKLGIPEQAILCYVQLGAGKINDIESELSLTLDALGKHPSVYTILGESLIGAEGGVRGERIRILREYPNSRYFKDFDFGIMASGYNSFHESIEAGLPTIFYPNLKTGRDDQLARAKIGAENGSMIVLESRTKEKISIAIERMLDKEVRDLMSHRSQSLRRDNGAEQVATWINDQLSSP